MKQTFRFSKLKLDSSCIRKIKSIEYVKSKYFDESGSCGVFTSIIRLGKKSLLVFRNNFVAVTVCE